MESQSEVAPPKKNNRTTIIIVSLIALLCCCLLIGGVAAYRSGALNMLTSYQGNADAQLRTDTMKLLGDYETKTNNCDNISLASAQMISQPGQSSDGSWTELWQISACGETHPYTILFTPSPAGGTDIHITGGQ